MSARPQVLVIGPTPPPLHGPAIYTRMILEAPAVRAAADVVHVDIADRRDLGNIGRLDARNVALALLHLARVAWLCATRPLAAVYVQPSQNALAYLRDAGFIVLGWASGARVVAHLHGEAFAHFRETAPAAVRVLIDASLRLVTEAWVLGDDLRDRFGGAIASHRVRAVANGIPETTRLALQEGAEEGASPRAEGAAAHGADADGHGGRERADAGARPAPLRVLHLGQLARSKGTDRVIAAVAELRDGGVDARLTLAGGWGSAEEEKVLRRLVEEPVEEGWCTLRGVVDGDEKAALLRRADALVLLSRFPPGDGQPLVILEAMAAGAVVVATPRGAVPETLAYGEAGVLVAEEGPGAVAHVLERLGRDPGERRRLAAAAKERFAARYTEQACAERFAGALRSVLERAP